LTKRERFNNIKNNNSREVGVLSPTLLFFRILLKYYRESGQSEIPLQLSNTRMKMNEQKTNALKTFSVVTPIQKIGAGSKANGAPALFYFEFKETSFLEKGIGSFNLNVENDKKSGRERVNYG